MTPTNGSKPKWIAVGNWFMHPYWKHEVEIITADPPESLREVINQHRDAMCLYSMNSGPSQRSHLQWATTIARQEGLRSIWQTIEDPNGNGMFLDEAKCFDFVFTSDRECIPQYQREGIAAYWLPLACSPAMHGVRDRLPEYSSSPVADLVFIGNHYAMYPSRQAFLQYLLTPLLEQGMSLALFSYKSSPWPESVQCWWRAETSCFDVARFYPEGKIALGANCQDGYMNTTMASQRVYEALACGKPLLSWETPGYQHLGFVNYQDMVWVKDRQEAVTWAGRLLNEDGLADAIAQSGKLFVLARHTYANRLDRIQSVLAGGADPKAGW